MVIIQGNQKTVKEMVSYSREGDGLSEFTNPRDRGTKYLKLGDELWMYFPDAEDLVRISGHMLRQGMMGRDFSYQDALESEKLTDLYQFELLGEEVSYYEWNVWIDQELYHWTDSSKQYFTVNREVRR